MLKDFNTVKNVNQTIRLTRNSFRIQWQELLLTCCSYIFKRCLQITYVYLEPYKKNKDDRKKTKEVESQLIDYWQKKSPLPLVFQQTTQNSQNVKEKTLIKIFKALNWQKANNTTSISQHCRHSGHSKHGINQCWWIRTGLCQAKLS